MSSFNCPEGTYFDMTQGACVPNDYVRYMQEEGFKNTETYQRLQEKLNSNESQPTPDAAVVIEAAKRKG